MPERFLDTNVLRYSISRDPGETRKRERAIALIDHGDVALSVQVLQEFYVQATRASRPDRIAHGVAMNLVRAWRRFPVVDVDVAVMTAAFGIVERHRLGYWDAAIVAAAAAAGCSELCTEGLNDGQVIGTVTVRDPFALPG
jgi:predicted nucleic acid-binding protein